MRLSIVDGDPGYTRYIPGIKVFFDDADIAIDCITADEELGFVVRYARDANNKRVFEDDSLRKVTAYGRVRIELPNLAVAQTAPECPRSVALAIAPLAWIIRRRESLS